MWWFISAKFTIAKLIVVVPAVRKQWQEKFNVPTQDVFPSPASIPDDIKEAIDTLFLEVGEEPPSTYALEGELHPALLLREYRGLLPGFRLMVGNFGL